MANIERGGIASVYINGAYYEVAADIKIKLGGEVRTAKIGSDGVKGYTTKIMAPEVTLTAMDGPQVSLAGIKAINGQTLQVTLNNGKAYLVYGATLVDDPEVNIAEGQIDSVKFTGNSATEQLAS